MVGDGRVTDAVEERRPTVLVIDDEESQRYFLRRALGRRGYTVAEATGAVEGFDRFRTGSPDCVVLDVRMPDGSGLEVLDRIQALRPGQPVVMLTAHATVGDAVAALQRGAADYLEKPATGEAVGAAVARALEGRAAEAGPPERREGLPAIARSPATRTACPGCAGNSPAPRPP